MLQIKSEHSFQLGIIVSHHLCSCLQGRDVFSNHGKIFQLICFFYQNKQCSGLLEAQSFH